jgi:hypothetical protein
METVSGRIPDDLYQWFASLRIEGAVTNSDKLRELLAQTKRQHEGSLDLVSAKAWFRDVVAPLRTCLTTLERDDRIHSEVLVQIVEHVSSLAAVLISGHPQDQDEAIALEDALVRRIFGITEALLRQAVTTRAAAYEPGVVRRHAKQTISLARLIS